jgi:hypothetical protein
MWLVTVIAGALLLALVVVGLAWFHTSTLAFLKSII